MAWSPSGVTDVPREVVTGRCRITFWLQLQVVMQNEGEDDLEDRPITVVPRLKRTRQVMSRAAFQIRVLPCV